MNPKDEWELAWWRAFATKFLQSDRPRVGEPLLGYRFVLYVDGPDGLVPWVDRT